MKEKERMRQLVEILQEASRAYYQESREIMSNFEYDALYDELLSLEKKTGIVLAGSPTESVGYEVQTDLPKETHASPMLSLDKTKSVDELVRWLSDQEALLSWKLDGLTIVLTYEDGKLAKAVTRGNGIVGEVVTPNARTFVNIPLSIPFKGKLILRGEAVIAYSDFEKMNEESDLLSARYKNPRNLCSGSVRQLNSEVTAKRHVRFYAFALVSAEGMSFDNSRKNQFDFLSGLGFDVVPHVLVTAKTLPGEVQHFAEEIKHFDIPSDGLVLLYEDIAYGDSLGTTAKFPRNSLAFKWEDEQAQTTLREIFWSVSRTGLINPVAVFDPVELEGTTVTRASVHNVSIVESLELGAGDELLVYKANMIIPQISENLTRSHTAVPPKICPVCGGKTKISESGDVRILLCTNPDCSAKKIGSYVLLASRDALNMEGLSEMTLEKLIAAGLIHEPADLFTLCENKDVITKMEGFGEKSFENLTASIERAKETTLSRFLYGLGIPGVGVSTAKNLARAFPDFESLRHAEIPALLAVDGIGEILAEGIVSFFADEKKAAEIDHLLAFLHFTEEEERREEQVFAGETFVITGSLASFANRDEMKQFLEERGAKVTGTVTKKTTCLINNDSRSTSAKNQKAKELGIPVRTEEEILQMAGERTDHAD